MNSKMRVFVAMILAAVTVIAVSGCGREANKVSYNISQEADNFNVFRKVIVINNQSDGILLEFEGWCSITKDNSDNQLELTYRVGEDKYYKDFVGLNDRVTYTVTQLDGSKVDPHYYKWYYHSDGSLIPIDISDAD